MQCNRLKFTDCSLQKVHSLAQITNKQDTQSSVNCCTEEVILVLQVECSRRLRLDCWGI